MKKNKYKSEKFRTLFGIDFTYNEDDTDILDNDLEHQIRENP